MTRATIGLGGNLGEPEKALAVAVKRICALPGVDFISASSLYRTEPIDSSGPDYLNAVLIVESKMGPHELLSRLLEIEKDLGRQRPIGVINAPRTVDLDLLMYGDEVSDDPFVILPHPRMTERAFVLVPLLEVDPKSIIAGKGEAATFLASVRDQRIERYKEPDVWLRESPLEKIMNEKAQRKQVKLGNLKKMYAEGEPIVMLTCYDATFASVEDEAGVDMMLVGDSLGMAIQGHSSTIPVTIEEMAYHTSCVSRGNKTAFILADMNFGSYLISEEQALENAVKLMKAGANMVKLEGGLEVCNTVRRLKQIGIPVCAHIGFTPQSVNSIGGFYVQGKTLAGEEKLRKEALALQEAGADMVLFEMVPARVAEKITRELSMPTIGIGAGLGTSGQVLVLQDILGIFPGRKPKFSKNFMQGASSIQEAIANYVSAVKSKAFPTQDHAF